METLNLDSEASLLQQKAKPLGWMFDCFGSFAKTLAVFKCSTGQMRQLQST
jgi:hypothetical protein